MPALNFSQVDVFADGEHRGNPVAVVHQAEALSDEQMASFARWTNLSETTFLLPPTHHEADYQLRIYTPGGELPFAGHPTLGSCHAWISEGGTPKTAGFVVQECAAGLISIRRDQSRLAFAAPPLRRSGALEPALRQQLITSLALPEEAVIADQWVDNGPGWCALLLDSAERVRSCVLSAALAPTTPFGIVGPNRDSGGEDGASAYDFEVRAFVPSLGVPEDPVTGSLNASLAQWLIGAGVAASPYVALQGTVIGRRGLVHVTQDDEAIWVGGSVRVMIRGIASFCGA